MNKLDLDNFEIPVEDFLEHFGVRGMRWGVRRRSEDSNSSQRSNAENAKSKARRKAGLKLLGGAAVVATVFVGANYLGRRAGEHKMAKVNKTIRARQGMDYMARGKNWIVETNNPEAFEMTMNFLRERGV